MSAFWINILSDTITLNFNSVENFQCYVSRIIEFYKNYKKRSFNEIIIKDYTNEIKYNFDLDILLANNVNASFDKVQEETEFIAKLIKSVKKLNIEFRCFSYISNNFKFEFSNRDDVSIHAKKIFLKL